MDYELEYNKITLENKDKKEDQIRAMAWVSLVSMILYPVLIIIAELMGLTEAPVLLSEIAPTFFVAVSALLAAFFGIEAYKNKQ